MRSRVALRIVVAFFIVMTNMMMPGRARASDVPANRARLIGHPRARFPLTIYAEPMPAHEFVTPIHDAITQWNVVFKQAFAIPAFVWTLDKKRADVIILFNDNDRSSPDMGETEVDADKRGIIRLPVKITLEPPTRRGGTGAAQVMFDVAAHELGHALGLPHINKPGSIMCCDSGALNFDDPAARAAYIAARRHPDLRSVLPDIETHYRRFWAGQASSTPTPAGDSH